ncbi:hypothetical protein AAC387_Pa10g1113 [Persea americana]
MQSKAISSNAAEIQQQQQPSSLPPQMPVHAPESSSGVQAKSSYQSMEPLYEEVMPLQHNAKRVNLSIHIPPRPMISGSKPNGKGPVHMDGYSKGSSLARGFFRGPSFKNQVPVLNERTPLLRQNHGTGSDPIVPENSSLANYIAALSWKRCVSLPVTHKSNLSPSVSISSRETTYNGQQHPSHERTIPGNVRRSLSVPVRNVVILRSASFSIQKELGKTNTNDGQMSLHLEDGDEEIPEDEAVCRICLDELCGRSSLKLECSCKGALSLLHEECAMKWFGNRGNKKCDVCAQEILNLPVTLFRIQSSAQDRQQHIRQNSSSQLDRQQHIRQNSSSQLTRAWQDVVMLILISTMCYFFFLEQLLVDDLNSQAINIAAPLSFSLGLLSSISAIFLASKDYVWSYSAFQFVLVALFLHLFYSVLQVNAVYAILVASLVGLGTAASVNSLVVFLAWRNQAPWSQTNISPI